MYDRAVTGLMILPVYSALTSDMQQRIFRPAPDGVRKVSLTFFLSFSASVLIA